MGKRVYVGNLPYSVDGDALQNLFAEFGAVESADVITDRYSGRSKGFGFVEMTNDDDATKAIEAMNGKEIDGRAVVVNEARPKEKREGRGGGGFRRGNRGGGGGRRNDW